MATNKEFANYIVDQLSGVDEITAKSMFGEYGIFCRGKIFGLICDNKLFIKPTQAGQNFIGNVKEAPPYKGAKNSFLIDGRMEDSEWLSELVRITVKELSASGKK